MTLRLSVLLFTLSLSSHAASETLRVIALSSERFFFEENGRLRGIEYEILDYFAKSRDATLAVEWVDSFSDLLPRIEAGKADIAAGTITITDERERRVDFSAGYFPVQVVLVERSGEASGSLKELAGAKVAAFQDTTAVDALKQEPRIEIVVASDGIEGMLEAVRKGEIRAAAADSSAVIPLLEDYPTLKISQTFGDEQHFGFALPKGSPLKEALSEHILRLKESGIYFRFLTDHMGPRATEIVRAARSR
ncbi:MAG TPA: transporter substrate-binding domain-containing protein [Vicinamibacteria bacterium]|nr:transporter substrate-binding domain-containing protein [Vicinamibacteria bacterium]